MAVAIQFDRCKPEDIALVMHLVCEQTPVYRDTTTLTSTLAGLKDFDCYAIRSGALLLGGIIFKGQECHIGILAKYRKHWATREVYRFFAKQSAERGVIQAKCGNPDALPFIQRLVNRGYVCLVNS
jgi:hypothetical protein